MSLRNEHYRDDVTYITQLTRNVLSLLGVWPSFKRESTGKRVRQFLLIVISYALLYGVLIPGLLFWVIERRTRVRVQTIPLILYGFMATGKYGNLIFRQKDIRSCLRHIEEDYRIVGDIESRDTMIECAKTGRRLVALCATFMYGSGLSFRSILPLSKGKIVTPQNITIKPLPCPAYLFSFDIQASPAYELVFLIQFLSGIVTYSITIGICGLAAVFVMHACGQLKILVELMENVVEEQWENKKHEVDEKLARMVEHQIRIRSFLQLVEDTLQQACLIEFLGCTIIVCLLGYCIIMEWENSNPIAMCSYFITITSLMINMFMFCYTGEQLTVEAERVATTSCELDWYRLPDKKARGIVLVMIMSNLPTKITAGKIMDLSFKTYGDIVKTSVTYFNMLLKVTD
ncbi:odorant receptor 13a-like [Pseudomyrmex gracilis]|uniref:odorant receptor 13a-like n=1 Tax=Pseudomyrmex gracilis TaxID=219809 RepID=UPI0009949E0F|nr:odorant receptor 13a-like [Pseudomyrmex gracilis]